MKIGEDISCDISHQIPSKDLLEAPRLRVGTAQQRRCVPPNALCPGAGHRDSHRGSELRGEQDPTCQYLRWHQGLQGMIRMLTFVKGQYISGKSFLTDVGLGSYAIILLWLKPSWVNNHAEFLNCTKVTLAQPFPNKMAVT